WLLCAGCQTFLPLEPAGDAAAAAALWEQGQAAMRAGQMERAIALYKESLSADPALTRNHMSLAAAYLERGNDAEACAHLARYVTAHREHFAMRTHYAELLLRLHRAREGCAEFERFIADAQEGGDDALRPLIQCHSRLMEVAEDQEDDYAAHLHRGIALYL